MFGRTMLGVTLVIVLTGACKDKGSASKTEPAPGSAGSAGSPGSAGSAAVMPDAAVAASTACLPVQTALRLDGDGGLRACTTPDEGKPTCIAIDLATGKASPSDKPSAPEPAAVGSTIKDEGGKRSTCAGDKCVAFGKKLTKAIAKAATDREGDMGPVPLAGTTDLEVVVVGSEPWSVSKDRKLAIKPPKEADAEFKEPARAVPMGNLIYVEWVPCAGPCATGRIVTSAGATVADDIGGGGPGPRRLDAKRWAVMSEYGAVQIFDDAGKAAGVIEEKGAADPNADPAITPKYKLDGVEHEYVGGPYYQTDFALLADGRLAIAVGEESLLSVADLSTKQIVQRWRIPSCKE